MVREKGTNRGAFFRGEVDKYTWVEIGSSYLPSDIIAAFLWAQLEEAEAITHAGVARCGTATTSAFVRPRAARARAAADRAARCPPNAHSYFLLLPTSSDARQRFIERLRGDGVQRGLPLCAAARLAGGRKYGRASGEMSVTHVGERAAGAPAPVARAREHQDYVIDSCRRALGRSDAPRGSAACRPLLAQRSKFDPIPRSRPSVLLVLVVMAGGRLSLRAAGAQDLPAPAASVLGVFGTATRPCTCSSAGFSLLAATAFVLWAMLVLGASIVVRLRGAPAAGPGPEAARRACAVRRGRPCCGAADRPGAPRPRARRAVLRLGGLRHPTAA